MWSSVTLSLALFDAFSSVAHSVMMISRGLAYLIYPAHKYSVGESALNFDL